jgi:CheY-like chemotaxis protein
MDEASADDAPRLHVLIVDDNATNRQILEIFLEHLGARWLSVENGAQAVAAAALHPFDAILMDIQMPVMDGLTATREIRRHERAIRRPETPVVVVSANCEPEDIVAARKAGAQLHVAKPISMQALFAALSAACDPEQQQHLAA